MASLNLREIGIKKIGRTVIVPQNPYAKLMYYLSCVDTLIQYNFNQRLINYEQYYNLTEKEKQSIKFLAYLLTPNILLKYNIIINKPELCENCSNEFYEITDTRLGFHTNSIISIGGIDVKVRKIMAFKGNWIETNYYRPLTEIHNIEQQNKFLQLPQSNFSFSNESIETTPKLSQRKSPSEKKKDNSCCSIW